MESAVKVLCSDQETSVVMDGGGESAPENGAIPMYRQGGPRTET